ncbi:hypothetical protein MTsN2n4_13260 [Pseudoalteromonas sp. MTN2-4]
MGVIGSLANDRLKNKTDIKTTNDRVKVITSYFS